MLLTIRFFFVCILAIALSCSDDDGSGAELTPDFSGKPATISKPAELYSSASPFNQAIGASPTIDGNSAALIDTFEDSGDLVIQVGQYSAPVYFADSSTPEKTVPLRCGDYWEMGVNKLGGVPVPSWAEPANDIDGAGNPPSGCGEDSDQDNHLIILDVDAGCEYNFWQARYSGLDLIASWGNSNRLDGTGIYDQGLSTRGSGFSFLAGLIWPEELEDGDIPHALAFSYPTTKSGGPVSPATDSDGITDSSTALPMGARVQLDPALDLDSLGLTDYEHTIAQAMQTYGMILVDTGGSSGIGLYTVDPKSTSVNPYDGLLPGSDFVTLANIPLSNFRVLELGAQDADFQDNIDLVDSGCGSFF